MEEVEVQLVKNDAVIDELFILCRSKARKEKEKAIVNKFTLRIENGLKKLQLLTLHPTIPLRNRDKLQREIGSLLGKNSRAAKMFDIKVEQVVSSDKKQRLSLSWQKKDNEDSWIDTSSGCYLLRTNIPPQLTAEEMWNAYIGLTKIEAAFRTLKSELVLRPIWHQKEDRVKAHIFICFLALILMRTFEYALQNVGLGNSPRKVL